MDCLAISLAFRVDGLSALMLALITGVGTWVFVYASGYLAHEPRRGRLPRYGPAPSGCASWRPLDFALAAAAGIGTFLLLAHLYSLPVNTELADWFAAHSLPEAHGRNVVNVIIVDFRALDTLGEIAVVAFSLLAALPLLAGLRKARAP